MKKIFLYSVILYTTFATTIQADGYEDTLVNENDSLPETSLSEPGRMIIGLSILALAFLVYKIRIDMQKIRKTNFENEIVDRFES